MTSRASNETRRSCAKDQRRHNTFELEEGPERRAGEDGKCQVIVKWADVCEGWSAVMTQALHTLHNSQSASETPAAIPPTTVVNTSPAQFPSTPLPHAHAGSSTPSGASPPKNPAVMHAPVTTAAVNPATLFLGAKSGSLIEVPGMGNEVGSWLVRRPNMRPTVEAVVSAHERL